MPRDPTSRLKQPSSGHGVECLASAPLRETSVLSDMHNLQVSDWSSESRKQVSLSTGNKMDDSLIAGDDQGHRLPGVANQTMCSPYLSQPLNITNYLSNNFWKNGVESTYTPFS